MKFYPHFETDSQSRTGPPAGVTCANCRIKVTDSKE